MKILISACLLGENCKYNGGNNRNPGILQFIQGHTVIPVCPECLGGLSTPRPPSELVDGRACSIHGEDVHEAFVRGAETALQTAKEEAVDLVILQSRSPSCGAKHIYDGSFRGRLIPGQGIFAQMLLEHGFNIADAEDIVDTLRVE